MKVFFKLYFSELQFCYTLLIFYKTCFCTTLEVLVQVEVILSGFVLNIDFWNFKRFFFTQLKNLKQSSHRILIKYN